MSDSEFYCPGLGVFSRLPPEIRHMVWSYLWPLPRFGLRRPHSPLAISRQLSLEFSPLIYGIISFHLSATFYHRMGQDLVIPFFFGQVARREELVMNASKETPLTPGLSQKFTRLDIWLFPPQDVSEFILIWQTSIFLVNLLRKCGLHFNINIISDAESESLWLTASGKPRRPPFIPDFWTASRDLRTVMSLPFQSLSPICNVSFIVVWTERRRCKPMYVRKDYTPEQIKVLIAAWSIELELQLDTVLTNLACYLRLERFKHWSTEYVDQVIHYIKKTLPDMNLTLHGVKQYKPYKSYRSKQVIVLKTFLDRYLDMRCYDPWNASRWRLKKLSGRALPTLGNDDSPLYQMRLVTQRAWESDWSKFGIPAMRDGKSRVCRDDISDWYPYLEQVRTLLHDAFYLWETPRYIAELGKSHPESYELSKCLEWLFEGPIAGAGGLRWRGRDLFHEKFSQSRAMKEEVGDLYLSETWGSSSSESTFASENNW